MNLLTLILQAPPGDDALGGAMGLLFIVGILALFALGKASNNTSNDE